MMKIKGCLFLIALTAVYVLSQPAFGMGGKPEEPRRTEKENREDLPEQPEYEKKKKEKPEPDARAIQIEKGLIEPNEDGSES